MLKLLQANSLSLEHLYDLISKHESDWGRGGLVKKSVEVSKGRCVKRKFTQGGSKIYWNQGRATRFFGGWKSQRPVIFSCKKTLCPVIFFIKKNYLPCDFFLRKNSLPCDFFLWKNSLPRGFFLEKNSLPRDFSLWKKIIIATKMA